MCYFHETFSMARKITATGLLLMTSCLVSIPAVPQNYFEKRTYILTKEDSQRVGGHLELTPNEIKVNTILMHEKQRDIDSSLDDGKVFPPAENFLLSKQAYETSKVFQIIRKMPKGGVLHLHDMAAFPMEWVVKNLTYRQDCYMCTDEKGTLLFHFFRKPPKTTDCQWERVSEARERSENIAAFDESIYTELSMTAKNRKDVYATNRDAWRKFKKNIFGLDGLGGFSGVTKDRLYETLKWAHDDNVMYVELRGLIPAYDLDGETLDREWVVKKFIEVLGEFQKDHPSFIGGKYILSSFRTNSNAKMRDVVKEAVHLRSKFPDIVAGFDISFDEDKGRPTVDFVDDLLYPSTLHPPMDLPYYLHAGETDWIGTRVDFDILDAILLGTKRIGHGFALHGHPEFLRLVKERDIAIEVNPISNQVLALINDLRVHPAVSLLAQNYTIVIGSDDPNAFDSLPASYDYYATFMALGGAQADLKFLKQLAINSIMYSAMKEEEKKHALNLWRRRWDEFIHEIISIDNAHCTNYESNCNN